MTTRPSTTALLAAAALACTATAQTVASIPAMTVPVFSTIDMDAAGPQGPVTTAAIANAGVPGPAAIANITLNASTAAAGVYNTNPGLGNGLALSPSGVGMEIVVPPTGAFAAFDAQIDFLSPITEFGLNIGDWNGPMILDFYLAGQLVTTFTTPAFNGGPPEFVQMTGGTFDRVDIAASTAAGNWVITDLIVEGGATGLFPGFTQDVTTGASPLTVTFTDTSFSSDPGGVVAWIWDFENDGTPDSQLQNPVHTYTACGLYDVSLTAIDAAVGPVTIVKTALIDVDPVVADFSASPLAAFAVSFTDLSTGGVNSWAWDFDNDGTVDSTVQNPVFGYANAGPHTVTLTTSSGCNTDTVVKDVSAVPVLCTTFAGGNGLSVGGNYFDITVTAPNGILITSLDVSAFAAGTGDVVVATAPTTYIGNESNPGAWTEVSRAVGVTVTGGVGTQDNIDVPDFFLAPGTYGMWVATPGGVSYTNGNGTNQAYSNGDLSLSLGAGAGTLGGGGQFTPRVWNGCIYYDNNPAGAYATFAPGCVGSAGTVSSLTAAGPPRINTTFSVAIDNLSAANVAIMVFSVNNQTFNGAPLPVALGQFGMPGCDGHVNPESTSLVLGTGGTGTWNLPIPNIPSFIGTAFYNQALIVDPGFNPLGAVMSDAAGGVVGQ